GGIRALIVTGVQTCALPNSSSAALVAPSCSASHISSSTTDMSTDSAMIPVSAQSSPVWVTMSEVKIGSPRYELLSRTYLAMIDFKIGRASCRERVWSWVVVGALQ